MPRIQHGDFIPVRVELPISPIEPPLLTITSPDGSSWSMLMAYLGTRPGAAGSTLHAFNLAFFAGSSMPLGIYMLTVSFFGPDLASQTMTIDPIEVVSGGDSGGAVIALYGYDRPEGRYTLAQLASGRLVQGRNPRL